MDRYIDKPLYKANSLKLMELILSALQNKDLLLDQAEINDNDLLCEIAERHGISGVLAYAVQHFGLSLTSGLKEKYALAIRRELLFRRELKMILFEFEKEKIRYLPLKGAVLQVYYPSVGTREMTDVDILIDPDRAEQARLIMNGLGYECGSFGKGHHDIYKKRPMFCIEIHRSLADTADWKLYTDYYGDVFSRLKQVDGHAYEYRFSDEDFYIFHILHAKIHYDTAGIDLRTLIDLFILLDRFDDKWDKEYIDRELEKLGAAGFEQQLTRTLCLLLKNDQTALMTDQTFDYMLFSGRMGSYNNVLDNQLKAAFDADPEHGVSNYLKTRFQTPESMLRDRYPFIYRHRKLEPILWFYRPIKKLAKRPKSIVVELQRVILYAHKK